MFIFLFFLLLVPCEFQVSFNYTSFNPNIPPSMVIFLFFLLLVPCEAQLSFNYNSFNPNIHEIKYYGDASPSDPVIQLTINQKDKSMISSTGRVTYSESMKLWDKASGALADFSTQFSFIINSQTRALHADGIAFFIAPVGFSIPDVQEGSGLGLVSGDQKFNSTSNPFVAVEFDTYANPWDPPEDHVGININSLISVKNVTWLSRIPFAQMNEAWISYNSNFKKLSVAFTGFHENATILQEFSLRVNLKKYLPELVTFGFSAATGSLFEIHTLHSWSFSYNIQINQNLTSPVGLAPEPMAEAEAVAPIPSHHKASKRGVIAGPIVGACVLISWLVFLWFCYIRKKKNIKRNVVAKKVDYDFNVSCGFEVETGPKKFSYKELAIATKDFVEEEKLGQGGFGVVYRGFLKDLNSYVAVKRVSKGSKQGIKEYSSEVKIISRLRHRNLVQLIGWCHEERELLLVYEFMPNGSLDSHLFKDNSFLTWVKRYNIARGLAAALLYLHEEWEQCVLHRDIKSSNVMLDSNFNAKLGDFGLARLVDHAKGTQTTVMAGTMGYMAPECLMTGKSSKESDVFSFGVVALEIGCGRKPIDSKAKEAQVRIVDYVWDLYGIGNILEAADPKLCEDFNEKQMECLLVVGLWCTYPDPKIRPSIKQAIQVLSFEAPLPRLPLKMPIPTYPAPLNMSEIFLLSPSHTLNGSERDQSQSSSSSCNTFAFSKHTTFSAASSSSALLSYTR